MLVGSRALFVSVLSPPYGTGNLPPLGESKRMKNNLLRRVAGENVWLAYPADTDLAALPVHDVTPEVRATEEAVGEAMCEEVRAVAAAKGAGEPVTIALLGGRGAQAMHRQLGQMAAAGDPDGLIARLHVFTQDALAPLPMGSAFSFVRDFERLLGPAFFSRVRSFTPMRTDVDDLEAGVRTYLEQLKAVGGLDIFFLGHGPEPGDASHLAYIKPGSGATFADVAGIIPISESILEHHIAKFRAGGTTAGAEEEAACRRASYILTLGPAAILSARRIVQSIVDADTAPAKKRTYRCVLETALSEDAAERARQLDENPGLWIRLHPNVRSLVLPNLLG
jgi:6-phosphogluconolactonase/glucosamine-6-phosphate isomerase/deaminase